MPAKADGSRGNGPGAEGGQVDDLVVGVEGVHVVGAEDRRPPLLEQVGQLQADATAVVDDHEPAAGEGEGRRRRVVDLGHLDHVPAHPPRRHRRRASRRTGDGGGRQGVRKCHQFA